MQALLSFTPRCTAFGQHPAASAEKTPQAPSPGDTHLAGGMFLGDDEPVGDCHRVGLAMDALPSTLGQGRRPHPPPLALARPASHLQLALIYTIPHVPGDLSALIFSREPFLVTGCESTNSNQSSTSH